MTAPPGRPDVVLVLYTQPQERSPRMMVPLRSSFSSYFAVVNNISQKVLSTLITQVTLPIFVYCLWA